MDTKIEFREGRRAPVTEEIYQKLGITERTEEFWKECDRRYFENLNKGICTRCEREKPFENYVVCYECLNDY